MPRFLLQEDETPTVTFPDDYPNSVRHFLLIGFLGMFIGAIVFFYMGISRKVNTVMHVLTFFIAAVSACSYYAEWAGLGVEYKTTDTTPRVIFWARYLDWVVTGPVSTPTAQTAWEGQVQVRIGAAQLERSLWRSPGRDSRVQQPEARTVGRTAARAGEHAPRRDSWVFWGADRSGVGLAEDAAWRGCPGWVQGSEYASALCFDQVLRLTGGVVFLCSSSSRTWLSCPSPTPRPSSPWWATWCST